MSYYQTLQEGSGAMRLSGYSANVRGGQYRASTTAYDAGMGFFLFNAIASVAKAAVGLAGKAVGSVAGSVVSAVKSVATAVKGTAHPTVTVHTTAGDISIDTSKPGWEDQAASYFRNLGVEVKFGNAAGQTISVPGVGSVAPWVPWAVGGAVLVAFMLGGRRR